MVALSLCDVMDSFANSERSLKLARRLIESTLMDRAEIEKFDESLAPDDPLKFNRQTAGLIRALYERWAKDAESLLTRIGDAEKRFGVIAEAEGLRDALGKTGAMLSVSLDDMEAGCRDIIEGRLHTPEEVRRDLHLSTR